jgi:hypothetical protein
VASFRLPSLANRPSASRLSGGSDRSAAVRVTAAENGSTINAGTHHSDDSENLVTDHANSTALAASRRQNAGSGTLIPLPVHISNALCACQPDSKSTICWQKSAVAALYSALISRAYLLYGSDVSFATRSHLISRHRVCSEHQP